MKKTIIAITLVVIMLLLVGCSLSEESPISDNSYDLNLAFSESGYELTEELEDIKEEQVNKSLIPSKDISAEEKTTLSKAKTNTDETSNEGSYQQPTQSSVFSGFGVTELSNETTPLLPTNPAQQDGVPSSNQPGSTVPSGNTPSQEINPETPNQPELVELPVPPPSKTICNTCGADITGNVPTHGTEHMLNDEPFSYRVE